MKDLKLDVDRHDLLTEDFDLSLVDELDRVRQNLRIRLWFFFGEWFLNTTEGVRFYDFITLKNPDLGVVGDLMKAAILDTRDVNEILEYNQNFITSTRKLEVEFTVNTSFGQLEFAGATL